MFLVYGWKYLMTKKEFMSVSIKKNLMKFIKELVIKKNCFCCSCEDCFICNRFKFIYKQYMHYIDNKKKCKVMENLFKAKSIWV